MPKRKPSVEMLFRRWMNDIGEDERKNFQLIGKTIVCRACSKKFGSLDKKFRLIQHLGTALHKKSVQKKLNSTTTASVAIQDEPAHPFYRWIKDIDEKERTNFQLDGNCVLCNVCFKRFSFDKKSQLTQHLETAKHKKSVQLKISSAVKLEKLTGVEYRESPGSKLCVFCTTEIGDFNVISDGALVGDKEALKSANVNDQILMDEQFLKGVLVICKKFQIHSKFATRKKWIGAGDERGVGFVKNVCCSKCYEDLIKLVELRDQIIKLQVMMKQLTQDLARSVVSTQPTRAGRGRNKSEFCFKSKTCLKFRKQVLKNHQQSVLPDQTKLAKTNEQKIVQNFTDDGDAVNSELNSKVFFTPVSTNQQPVIKVELLDHSLTSSKNNEDDYDNFDDCTYHNDDDDETSLSPLPVLDNVYSLNENEQREKYHLKEQIRTITEDPKENTSTERKSDGPIKKNIDKEAIPQKSVRKKRKRRKFKIITEESSSDENDDGENEYVSDIRDNECESESDDNYQIKNPRANPRNGSSNPSLVKVKKIPRHILKGDGPSFRPIYVLNTDTGSLMFLNVEFQKTQNSLLCRHPECSEEISFIGYFTDQTAFLIMRLHIQQFHRGGQNQFKPITYSDSYHFCCHCEVQLKSRVELIRHRQELHKDFVMPSAICEICGYVMSDALLTDHLITHKSAEEKEFVAPRTKGRRRALLLPQHFPCDKCDRVYPNATQLRIHRERHKSWEERKAFICYHCGDTFVARITMEHHIRRVHFKEDEPTPFECEICGRKYMCWYRDKYEAHVRSHKGEKPFQCEQCGKSFGAKWSLRTHERTHRNEQIPCEFCGQIYKDKKSMRKHQLKHHPELVKRNPGSVKNHGGNNGPDGFIGPKLMHPCEPCGHVFVFKSMLVAHLKRVHKMELETNEDYPTMFTWEDSVDIK